LFDKGYKAVYLAIGAHKGIELAIPGEKAEGVRQGVDFLREVNLSGKAAVGKRMAIIGGGNVAVDVARAGVRLGAGEVNMIYRRTRSEMPAWEEEIHAAELEGVKITYLCAPLEVITNDGKVSGLRCIRMELGEPDASGRRRPIPVPGSEFDMEIDQLIPAIGQRPDLAPFEKGTDLSISRSGTLEVDRVTYGTLRPGVFAGGDVQTGPGVAIGAVAAGREAAVSISRYLDGKDMAEGRAPLSLEKPVLRPIEGEVPKKDRAPMPELAPMERRESFREVELGYDERTGREEAGRCLNCGYCSECLQCVDACMAKAVIHDQKAVEREIRVGSVVLCPGASVFDPAPLENFYHYQSHPNVMTSLEFERILSASGPTMGHLVRPSDKKEPQRIAWLQCVGSRDNNRCGNGYCSSFCCMYAIKEAVVAKEHSGGSLETTIFFMDMRTFGKDYEKYYDRAREEHGVRFVRSRVHTIDPIPGSDDLSISYCDELGNIHEEVFDLAVLSVGLQMSQETAGLAHRLGVDLNQYNFAVTQPLHPIETSRPGVFASGIFQGPKDIPSSVTDASSSACAAGMLLSDARWSDTKSLILPDERDVTGEEPRIGVFVCNCGINIGGVVDVPAVTAYSGQLPKVVFADQNLFSCSQDNQEKMKEIIEEHRLNRIVVASCSPRTHERLFQETLQACGLNKYLFEMANIRDQNSWVHGNEPLAATQTAKDLIRMAVARAGLLKPLREKKIKVNKRGLVIGGVSRA
jgi:heterodisulfide reductase subunit A-like polyferredoxin